MTETTIALGGSRRKTSGWRTRLLASLQAVPLALLLLLVFWPRPAWGIADEGGRLFDLHCAGCHPQGGNILRRGQTLKEAALRRRGIEGAAAVAAIAANGIGQMGGYDSALGEGGAESVGAWVWQQAQAGWPRQPVPAMDPSAESAGPPS